MLENFGFTFYYWSCQVPKLDKDLCSHSMGLLCVGSDFFVSREKTTGIEVKPIFLSFSADVKNE